MPEIRSFFGKLVIICDNPRRVTPSAGLGCIFLFQIPFFPSLKARNSFPNLGIPKEFLKGNCSSRKGDKGKELQESQYKLFVPSGSYRGTRGIPFLSFRYSFSYKGTRFLSKSGKRKGIPFLS
jgi:hypothetical protein